MSGSHRALLPAALLAGVLLGGALLGGVLLGGVRAEEAASPPFVSEWDHRALERYRNPPLGLPPVPTPDANPPTPEKIALGRKLFFDRRLSFNRTMSCGMCHVPEQGFTNNELATPVGVEGRSLRRNAPTILNAAYAVHVFRDGRDISLETQALAPLIDRTEMANPTLGWVLSRIAALPDYDGQFESAFGDGPSPDRIGQAVASWQRTMLAGNSPFDRWRYGNDADALSAEAQAGFKLFTGRARCDACHAIGDEHALFTDEAFHNTGIGVPRPPSRDPVRVETSPGVTVAFSRDMVESVGEPRPSDLGRFEVTLDPKDRWRFKTPSLRNVALTAPYMHDGSLRTLGDVVRFYDGGGRPHEGLDPLIRPLNLGEAEVKALVAFLHSLTSPDVEALERDARSGGVGN
jgi:cytochrome c peroxidase